MIVPINQFMRLDAMFLDAPLPKIIYVWGKYQERYSGMDGLEHYKWKFLYSEILLLEKNVSHVGPCKSQDEEEICRVYDYFQL